MKIIPRILTVFIAVGLPVAAVQAQDAALLAAERARGIATGSTGVQWTVDVKSGAKTAKFDAVSQSGKIYAEVLSPADAAGRKYIAESDGDMWFWKPGLTRPVSVSKRQRLSGDAAIGDIASTSFVDGYKVKGAENGEVDGEPATIYTMEANSLGDTYKQIKYWVTKSGNLGKKAEFYAKSGKMVRTATMEYNNKAGGGPFLSQMTIKESGKTIDVRFSNVKIGKYPSDLFDRDNLGGNVKRAGPKRK